jgi:hypothetical protein
MRMKRITVAFAVTLYVLLAFWFYYLVSSAPCLTTCNTDLRGVFLAPVPFVLVAVGLLLLGAAAYRRLLG